MEVEEIILTRSFAREEEKEIVEVPFHLPDHVDELSIEMKVDQGAATIDLGLKDPDYVRGWSGGSKSKITVGVDTATPGYSSGDFIPGEWAVLLGAYKVPNDGCQVELKVCYRLKNRRWIKGDLHGHSVHSDGDYTLAEIHDLAKRKGLDFIGLTDHNTTTQNSGYPSQSEVVFIPGMELTTYRGHCNLLGVAEPIEDFRTPDREALDRNLRTAHEKGAKITINHPNDTNCEGCSWSWGWDVDFDWIEVWNGPWRDINQRTLDGWHSQLCSGKKQIVVGGSDTHRPDPYVKHDMPTNWVCVESRSVKGILEAINKGHVFISYDPKGPFIELNCGSYMMGDTVCGGDENEVKIRVSELNKGDLLKVISDEGEEVSESAELKSKTITLKRKNQHFYRVEIWRYFDEVQTFLMAALSNPIYFK